MLSVMPDVVPFLSLRYAQFLERDLVSGVARIQKSGHRSRSTRRINSCEHICSCSTPAKAAAEAPHKDEQCGEIDTHVCIYFEITYQ